MNTESTHSLKEFLRTTEEMNNLYSTFAKSCGLAMTEYWALLLIYDGVVTQTQISEQLSLSRQTLNSAFKQLIKKGLVTLRTRENNQRTKIAELTPAGRTFAKEQVKRMHDIEQRAWQKLKQSEQEILVEIIRKFTDSLRKTLEAQ